VHARPLSCCLHLRCSPPAVAATCTSAYEATQRLRRAGKLRAADAQSTICGADTCAAWIRKECLAWHDEIVSATPSLAVSAVGADGCDLTRARVLVDGVVVAEQLDGRATPLDPGSHVVRVEAAGQTPNEREVLLPEGQKNRTHVVRFAPEGIACGVPAPPKPEPRAQAEARGTSPLVYVFGGIGLASLGVGSAFEVSGLSQQGTLDDCRPRCATSDVDSMRTTYLVGDVLVAAGAVSLGIATVLYITGRSSGPVTTASTHRR
jgi:hypothetical protein